MSFLDWFFGKNAALSKPQAPPAQSPMRTRKAEPLRPVAPPHVSQSAARQHFRFVIYEAGEDVAPNTWYQKSHWNNKNFVSYRAPRDNDPTWIDVDTVKVSGISFGTRAVDLLSLACSDDFTLYVEAEPDNPVSPTAIKVMACATVHGRRVSKHVGYLPDEVTTTYAGETFAISPARMFLPPNPDLHLGLEVALRRRAAPHGASSTTRT
jgi:hypothetical protein